MNREPSRGRGPRGKDNQAMVDMEVRILGTFCARSHNVNVVPRAQQQRQLFAQLVLAGGRVVGTADMTAEIWEDRPPASATTVIQTYVVALRKVLARALGVSIRAVCEDVLITEPNGYSLVLDRFVDAQHFEDLARTGSRLLADGRPGDASRHLSQALELWRGPVLAGVRIGPRLHLDVTRLTLAGLVATEQRIESDLQLGRHYEVLAELAGLTARHPLDETLHQQYMLALYRTGRRTKALEVYHRLRAVLATELGLEPCRGAQRLHQAILRAEPELDRAAPCIA